MYTLHCTYLEVFVHLVGEVAEEVVSILLLTDVHRLPPQLEGLPEALWSKELQLALQEVPIHTLHFRQNARREEGGGEGGGRGGRGEGREGGGRG